ncbi:MAG: hypothetical protein V4478_01680 [Patescibacteria group bacterium]
MDKLIPAFGTFSPEELSLLEAFTKEEWGVACKKLGTLASSALFVNLPFREEIVVPALIIGTRWLHLDDLPNCQNIKDARKCKVVIVLQENAVKEDYFSTNDWPDYFVDSATSEIIVAQLQCIGYQKLAEVKAARFQGEEEK